MNNLSNFSYEAEEMHAGAADFEGMEALRAADNAARDEGREAMDEARGNDGVPVFYSQDELDAAAAERERSRAFFASPQVSRAALSFAQMPDFVGAGYKMSDRELFGFGRLNE